MYSCGTPHMDEQRVGRPARTYIQQLCTDRGCSMETYWEWWTIGMSSGSGLGKSMLATGHDDDAHNAKLFEQIKHSSIW